MAQNISAFSICDGDICCYQQGQDYPFLNGYNLMSSKPRLEIAGKTVPGVNFRRCELNRELKKHQHQFFYSIGNKKYSVYINAFGCDNGFDNMMMRHQGVYVTPQGPASIYCRFNEIL